MNNLIQGLAVLLLPGLLAAQDKPPIDVGTKIWSVRHANSRGQHVQAQEAAQALLAHPRLQGRPWVSLRCDALLHLYLAQVRLEQQAAADRTYQRFVTTSKGLKGDHDLIAQMADLRRGLGQDLKGLRVKPRPPFQPQPDPDWRRLSAAQRTALVDPGVLTHLARLSREAGGDGLLILHRGRILLEEYGPRYRGRMLTMSSVKSMAGLLVGLALEDGLLEGVTDRVGSYLPDWRKGRRARVTLDHLLSMSSGLLRLRKNGVASAPDGYAFVRGLQPQAEPGSRWAYSNEGVQLLAAVLSEVLDEPLTTYARRRLFEPCGMAQTRLRTDRKGNALCHADASTTLRDFARLGWVMGQGGKWKGRQVIPADWLRVSLTPSKTKAGYGYLWWLYGEDCFAMEGYLSTNCWIWPKTGLVVARVQSRPSLLRPKGLDERAFRRGMSKLLK